MEFVRLVAHGSHPVADEFPTSVRGWRRWLDISERLNGREFVLRLQEAVDALNRRAMPPRKRVQVLELLEPGIRRALDYLAERVHAQPLPLPAPTGAAHRLMLDLLDELAGR